MANEILRYCELVEEASYAQTPLPAAGNANGIYLDITSTSLDLPNETDQITPSAFGRSANRKYAGFYSPDGDIVYPTNVRTIAHILKWALGGYAFTAGAAGVAEVQTLTFTTAADVDGGNYSVTLPDTQGVAQTYNFVAAAGATTAALATQVAGGVFTGWTAVAAGSVVTFTRTVAKANTTLGIFTPGASGAAAAFARTTAGSVTQLNTHEAWGSDLRILPSFLARIGKDNLEHVFSGCVVDSIELAVEDALLQLTVNVSASVDSKAPLQSKSIVFAALPSEKEIPFHQVAVTILGVLQERKLKNITISINNNSDNEAGRYLGKRYPGRIPVNERETTVSTEMDFSDTAQIERIWGAASGPSDTGAIEFPMDVTFFGGKDVNGLDQNILVKLPRVFYTRVESQPDGRNEITQPVSMRAMTGNVTLSDTTTTVATDIYTKVQNHAAIVQAAV